MDILQGLVWRPPAEVASWAIDQVTCLSRTDADVEHLPVFQVAGALHDAPRETRQALVYNAIHGFGTLPPPRRAEGLRVAVHAADALRLVNTSELTKFLPGGRTVEAAAEGAHGGCLGALCVTSREASEGREVLPEQSNSKVIEALPPTVREPGGLCGASWSRPTPGSTKAAPPYAYARASTEEPAWAGPPELAGNFERLLREVKFGEMAREEAEALVSEILVQSARLMQPRHLVDVVPEMDSREREDLSRALVDARIVPEEQRGILEEVLRPGGYSDKLAALLRKLQVALRFAWIVVALPMVELLAALKMGHAACGAPLVPWIRIDSVLAVCSAGVVGFIAHTFAPVYCKLSEDPAGAVERWQQLPEDCEMRVTLETVLPGVEFGTYHTGGIGMLTCCGLVLLGVTWAVIGAFELLATPLVGCSSTALLVSAPFVTVRFAVAVIVLVLLYRLLDEIQRHRSRLPLLGGSLSPIYEETTPRPLRMVRAATPGAG